MLIAVLDLAGGRKWVCYEGSLVEVFESRIRLSSP